MKPFEKAAVRFAFHCGRGIDGADGTRHPRNASQARNRALPALRVGASRRSRLLRAVRLQAKTVNRLRRDVGFLIDVGAVRCGLLVDVMERIRWVVLATPDYSGDWRRMDRK
jgi:hypothetical protein